MYITVHCRLLSSYTFTYVGLNVPQGDFKTQVEWYPNIPEIVSELFFSEKTNKLYHIHILIKLRDTGTQSMKNIQKDYQDLYMAYHLHTSGVVDIASLKITVIHQM